MSRARRPHYTPSAMRSHEIWREIERATGRQLMVTTGGVILSSQTRTAEMHVDHFFENTFEAARTYGIEHESRPLTPGRLVIRGAGRAPPGPHSIET